MIASPNPESRQPDQKELSVLVVDDNRINRRVLEMLLQRIGHHAETVNSGQEAIERIRSQNYDAILMDIQMPEMDGLEATIRIREIEAKSKRPSTFICAVTAHALLNDREKCLDAGMNDYMTKPVNRGHLSSILDQLPGRS